MSKKDFRLFLLDGMALVYRAHFALIRSPIYTSSGFNSSAIFGFANTLQRAISLSLRTRPYLRAIKSDDAVVAGAVATGVASVVVPSPGRFAKY